MSGYPAVGIVCRGCGYQYLTRVRGKGTRCPRCDQQRYIRVEQQWEGPHDGRPAPRPSVRCTCRHCGNHWNSHARGGTSLRCPHCRTSIRVPRRTDEMPSPTTAVAPQTCEATYDERERSGTDVWRAILGAWNTRRPISTTPSQQKAAIKPTREKVAVPRQNRAASRPVAVATLGGPCAWNCGRPATYMVTEPVVIGYNVPMCDGCAERVRSMAAGSAELSIRRR
jgi:predicted Zn-ribbon and HTH transcriptional regulator